MKIQVFPSENSGIVAVGVYVILLFGTLGKAPDLVALVSGLGILKPAVVFLFLAFTAIVLRAAFASGRITSPSLWLTVAAIVLIQIVVSRYTVAVAEQMHLLIYAVLGFLIFNAARFRLSGGRLFLASGLATAAFGVMDEVIQYFLPNRFFDWRDILINIIGGVTGLMVIRFVLGDRGMRCSV